MPLLQTPLSIAEIETLLARLIRQKPSNFFDTSFYFSGEIKEHKITLRNAQAGGRSPYPTYTLNLSTAAQKTIVRLEDNGDELIGLTKGLAYGLLLPLSFVILLLGIFTPGDITDRILAAALSGFFILLGYLLVNSMQQSVKTRVQEETAFLIRALQGSITPENSKAPGSLEPETLL